MRNKQSFCLPAVALLFFQCSTKKLLVENFSENFTGQYLYETSKFTGQKRHTIYINPTVQMGQNIMAETAVKRDSWVVIPAIIFNYWDARFSLKFGSKLVTEPIDSLMISTLTKEIYRSCSFNLTNNPLKAEYELLISIDSLNGKGFYTRGAMTLYLLFASSYDVWERAGPFAIEMVTTYKLLKNNETVFERQFSSLGNTGPYSREVSDAVPLQKDYVVRVVETISEVIKNTNSSIAKNIDGFLVGN